MAVLSVAFTVRRTMPQNEKGHAAPMARNLGFDLWLTPPIQHAAMSKIAKARPSRVLLGEREPGPCFQAGRPIRPDKSLFGNWYHMG
jgi:hypothetical protein